VDIGDNFEFDCIAQGYPKPNISWIRADSKALHGGLAKFNVNFFATYISVFYEYRRASLIAALYTKNLDLSRLTSK
jgi:hypothetical protein